MAQATVINIGKPQTNPADADVIARKLKLASAFQGMEGDICDMLQASRLVSLCLEKRLSGTKDQIQTDEDGRRYLVIAMDDVDMIQFAGFELCDRVRSLHEVYHRVFTISEN